MGSTPSFPSERTSVPLFELPSFDVKRPFRQRFFCFFFRAEIIISGNEIALAMLFIFLGVLCTWNHWIRGNMAMAGIFFDSVLDMAMLTFDCQDESDWPFSRLEVLHNFNQFQERFYTAGKSISNIGGDHGPWPGRKYPGPDLKWQAMPASASITCPASKLRHPIEQLPNVVGGDVRASCLIPIMWPSSADMMTAVVETYAGDCHRLIFFCADPLYQAPYDFMGYQVINLLHMFPSMLPDNIQDFNKFHDKDAPPSEEEESTYTKGTFNTIQKVQQMDFEKMCIVFEYFLLWMLKKHEIFTFFHFNFFQVLHMLLYQSKAFPDDAWSCRLDTDTYFVPRNFHRLVMKLDPDEPHYLGNRQFFHKNMAPGIVFSIGGAGVCLSRQAMKQLGEELYKSSYTADPGP